MEPRRLQVLTNRSWGSPSGNQIGRLDPDWVGNWSDGKRDLCFFFLVPFAAFFFRTVLTFLGGIVGCIFVCGHSSIC